MTVLLQIVIFLLAAGLLVYLYLLLTNKSDARDVRRNKNELDHRNAIPKPRYCPVCRSRLGPHDSLFAEMYLRAEKGVRSKVFIHGCRYCYRPVRDGEEQGGTDIDAIKGDDV